MLDDSFRQRITGDLVRDEGEKLRLYKCTAGKVSIGIGRNLEDKGISPAESRFLLDNDIAEVERELDRELPWWRNLPEPQRLGLFNMMYNLGAPKLAQFKGMLGALRNGDGDAASQHALQSKWAAQVGARAQRIAALFRQR